ncbi:MAG: hypothetical protein EBY48_03040 [Opitutae bacterium]|nr:hypothetical protein [Opitutae bacterium]
MKVTLNKDGTPRKVGSGKTKGAGSFEDQDIVVSRVWLRSVGALSPKRRSKKKGSIPPAAPASNPVTQATLSPRVKTVPKIQPVSKPNEPQEQNRDEDDYDPPPLFASIGEIKKY